MKVSRLILLTSLFAQLCTANASLNEIPLSEMNISEGESEVRTLASGLSEINGARFRAVVLGNTTTSARLRFVYRGQVDRPLPLESGALRIQIGHKLLAADPCNLLYVMWRLYPDEALVVSIKRNPRTTSAACGNSGYTNISSVAIPPRLSARDGATRNFISEYNSITRTLKVSIDGEVVWLGQVPSALITGLRGPSGVRSDNGKFRFRFYTNKLSANARSIPAQGHAMSPLWNNNPTDLPACSSAINVAKKTCAISCSAQSMRSSNV